MGLLRTFRTGGLLSLCAGAAMLAGLAACGPVLVRAEGSTNHVDWTVGVPF